MTAVSVAQDAPAQPLVEKFPVGYDYKVEARVELKGSLVVPGERGKAAPAPLEISGESSIKYHEKVLGVDRGGVNKTVRVWDTVEIKRTLGGRPQEATLRPGVRRLVLLRKANQEVPFSPDGPLFWEEIDLVRTDVFTPALLGLLPGRDVKAGDAWQATEAAVKELTDLEKLEEGGLRCTYDRVETVANRRHARVNFAGTVRGPSEDGATRQTLTGHFYFDLTSHHLSYLTLKGEHVMLDKDGKQVGKIEGVFVLTRRPAEAHARLSAEALRGVNLEPDDDNTLLLYENAELGVKFLYPRRWRVGLVRGPQIALDAADGHGLLLTVEPPDRVPSAEKFADESRNFLLQQKANIKGVDKPRRVRETPPLDRFGIDAELNRERIVMDYYVTKGRRAGATLAARLLPADLAAVQKEVERIARSLEFPEK